MKKIEDLLKKALQLQKDGDLNSAEKIYIDIINSYPEHPDANHNIASLYFARKDYTKAHDFIKKVIDTEYPLQEYFITASRIFFQLKMFEECLAILDKAISIKPEEMFPSYLKSVLLNQLGRYEEAEDIGKQLVEKHNNHTVFLNHYGVTLCNLEKYEEGIEYFKKTININERFRDPFSNLGHALHKIQSFNLSIDAYKKSLKLDPNHNQTIINYGAVYHEMGNYIEAEKLYKLAIQNEPDNPEVYNNIGVLYGEIGEKEKAIINYKKALELDPNQYKVFRHLCSTGELKTSDPNFIRMEKLFENEIPDDDKMLIGFGLGFIYDKNKEYKKAFKFIDKANEIQNNKINYNHDIVKIAEETRLQYDILLEKKTSPYNDFRPIFIVGMPRSGTSMIEKVLGNNTKVDEMGELVTLNNIITKKIKNNISWPMNISLLEQSDICDFRNQYVNIVKEINPKVKKVFVDKMPGNFVHIGLIKKIFPESIIINTIRDPLDTCLSIYFLKFSDQHRYSFNLKNLGEYYIYYKKIMDFWKEKFPNDIYSLNYEKFISKPKEETKNLYQFCNLDYKENDERFDLNKKITRTASSHQVREKIHKKSFNRWQNYKEELKELIEIFKINLGA